MKTKNRFQENLITFLKKQNPELFEQYEELYNLYADGKAEFRSCIHTLEQHLDSILVGMLESSIINLNLNGEACIFHNKDLSVNSKEYIDECDLLKMELKHARTGVYCNDNFKK